MAATRERSRSRSASPEPRWLGYVRRLFRRFQQLEERVSVLERQCDELRAGGGVLASASAPAPGGSASALAPAPGGSSGAAPAPGGSLGARASIISSDEVDGVEEDLRWDDAAQCHDEEMARRQKDAHVAHMMDAELNEIVESWQ